MVPIRENGKVVGIPASLLVILTVYGLCWVLLRQLPYGRHLYAIGCGEQSAKLVGINVDRTKIAAYAILGLLACALALPPLAGAAGAAPTIGVDAAAGPTVRRHTLRVRIGSPGPTCCAASTRRPCCRPLRSFSPGPVAMRRWPSALPPICG